MNKFLGKAMGYIFLTGITVIFIAACFKLVFYILS